MTKAGCYHRFDNMTKAGCVMRTRCGEHVEWKKRIMNSNKSRTATYDLRSDAYNLKLAFTRVCVCVSFACCFVHLMGIGCAVHHVLWTSTRSLETNAPTQLCCHMLQRSGSNIKRHGKLTPDVRWMSDATKEIEPPTHLRPPRRPPRPAPRPLRLLGKSQSFSEAVSRMPSGNSHFELEAGPAAGRPAAADGACASCADEAACGASISLLFAEEAALPLPCPLARLFLFGELDEACDHLQQRVAAQLDCRLGPELVETLLLSRDLHSLLELGLVAGDRSHAQRLVLVHLGSLKNGQPLLVLFVLHRPELVHIHERLVLGSHHLQRITGLAHKEIISYSD